MNRTLCPLCGSDNACAMEAKTGKCWCADVKFTPELLARVPAQAQGEVCICRSCTEKANATGGYGGAGKAPSS